MREHLENISYIYIIYPYCIQPHLRISTLFIQAASWLRLRRLQHLPQRWRRRFWRLAKAPAGWTNPGPWHLKNCVVNFSWISRDLDWLIVEKSMVELCWISVSLWTQQNNSVPILVDLCRFPSRKWRNHQSQWQIYRKLGASTTGPSGFFVVFASNSPGEHFQV